MWIIFLTSGHLKDKELFIYGLFEFERIFTIPTIKSFVNVVFTLNSKL